MHDTRRLDASANAHGTRVDRPVAPWHYSGDIIAIDFTADPGRVAELVPAGFSPRGDSSCTFFFCDWCSAADRDPRVKDDPIKGQYREAYVTLNGTFDDRPFGRVPYIWVDSELSLLRGQIQGFPKKLGFIARPGLGLVGDPGGDTTSSIARDFGDRAVGIMQPNLALAAAVPGQELHPVGADALVAVAEPPGQLIPGLDACELLLHHQKVVSASMRFHKRNHSSSASWNAHRLKLNIVGYIASA